MKPFFDHVDAHAAEYIADLQRLLRQPSISAQGIGVAETAAMVRECFEAAGGRARLVTTPGARPVVYAEFDGALRDVDRYECLFLGDEGGDVAGCVALDGKGGPLAVIKRFYVRPSSRGRGIGRKLVERLLEEARRRGYRSVRLGTLVHMDAARRLYRELGFRPAPPHDGHDEPHDAEFMQLDLATEGR